MIFLHNVQKDWNNNIKRTTGKSRQLTLQQHHIMSSTIQSTETRIKILKPALLWSFKDNQ